MVITISSDFRACFFTIAMVGRMSPRLVRALQYDERLECGMYISLFGIELDLDGTRHDGFHALPMAIGVKVPHKASRCSQQYLTLLSRLAIKDSGLKETLAVMMASDYYIHTMHP